MLASRSVARGFVAVLLGVAGSARSAPFPVSACGDVACVSVCVDEGGLLCVGVGVGVGAVGRVCWRRLGAARTQHPPVAFAISRMRPDGNTPL